MTSEPARRSDRTRAAILAAARDRFAADGYERATIRVIAADAQIDPAMVMRYFGSKDRLFAAAIDIEIGLPDLTKIPRSRLGAELVRFFVERWERDDTLVALLRAAAGNEPLAIDLMRSVFAKQIKPAISMICPDPREAATRTAMVASQVLGIALARYVLRVPPMAGLSADDLVAWVGPTIQRYLTGKAPS